MPISKDFEEKVNKSVLLSVRLKIDVEDWLSYNMREIKDIFAVNEEMKEMKERFAAYEERAKQERAELFADHIIQGDAQVDKVRNDITLSEEFSKLKEEAVNKFMKFVEPFGLKKRASNPETTRLSGATRDAGAISGARPKEPDVILRPPQETTPEREKKVDPAKIPEANLVMHPQQTSGIREENINMLLKTIEYIVANTLLSDEHLIEHRKRILNVFEERKRAIAEKVLDNLTQQTAEPEQKAKETSENRKFLEERKTSKLDSEETLAFPARLDDAESKLITRKPGPSEHHRIMAAIIQELNNVFIEHQDLTLDDADYFLQKVGGCIKDIKPQRLIKDSSPRPEHPIPAPRRFPPIPAPRLSLRTIANQVPDRRRDRQQEIGEANSLPPVNNDLVRRISCSKGLDSITVKLNAKPGEGVCQKFSLINLKNCTLQSLKNFILDLNQNINSAHEMIAKAIGENNIESSQYAQYICTAVDDTVKLPEHGGNNIIASRAFAAAVLYLCKEEAVRIEREMKKEVKGAEELKASKIKEHIVEHLTARYPDEISALEKEVEKRQKDAGRSLF